ncbi:hypothetical protein [Polaribacter septentrionalilitoris]|uniref:hypothetical protein n=1 Tax=Polaribacter septentrionalilitoris TaxID=2494657 RepID=UPI001358BB62|nr:hypothetical protein [Polaribacter septentrionalilitoris]
MSEENINNIIQKYEAGKSSLVEEKILFNNADEANENLKTWATYVKRNQAKVPENLNEKLWKSFEDKTAKKNNFKLGFVSTAASIALIMSFYLFSRSDNKLRQNEKEALLNEAKNMFQDSIENNPIHRILLEDELVIVYTKIE